MERIRGRIREATLPEVGTIERAKKGKIYPGGETLIELSATKGAVSYHSSSGPISTRYEVVTPKDMIPEYFFVVVEMGLAEFIHKYLTTINLKIEALNHYKITYHEDPEDQEAVIKVARMADDVIAAEEKEIQRLKDLKSFYQATMFVDTAGLCYVRNREKA